MTRIDFQQANQRFQELMELAAQGEEVIIDKDRQPFVKLMPVLHKTRLRTFGSAQGMIVLSDDFDEPPSDSGDPVSETPNQRNLA